MRMDLAEKVMETRDHKWDEKRKERFIKLGSNLGQRRDKEIKNIRQKFGRELRKLAMKHRCKTVKRYKRQDIIKQHADPASELYAPQMRFGINPQRRHEVLEKKFLRQDFVDSRLKILLNWFEVSIYTFSRQKASNWKIDEFFDSHYL